MMWFKKKQKLERFEERLNLSCSYPFGKVYEVTLDGFKKFHNDVRVLLDRERERCEYLNKQVTGDVRNSHLYKELEEHNVYLQDEIDMLRNRIEKLKEAKR